MTQRDGRQRARALGLAQDHEVVYRAAVELGLVTAATLAAHPFCSAVGITAEQARQALRAFASQRLVTQALGRPGHYEVVDPGLALDKWAAELETAARAARREIDRLSERHRRRENGAPEAFVEVIQDIERAKTEVLTAHLSAKYEVLAMERAPYEGAPGDLAVEQLALMEAGVVHKVIYELTEVESRRADIELSVRAGEQARARADVPLRAFIVDRHIAFVPGRRGSFLVDPLVIVHEGSLLDAVLETFDACWASAVPLSRSPAVTNPERRLVELLAAGNTDDAIARHLGVSRRTVQRRVSALMRQWGVQNRFQAGLVARERGLVG